jgi:hypothetical protein
MAYAGREIRIFIFCLFVLHMSVPVCVLSCNQSMYRAVPVLFTRDQALLVLDLGHGSHYSMLE